MVRYMLMRKYRSEKKREYADKMDILREGEAELILHQEQSN